jgi:hypothetical protein
MRVLDQSVRFAHQPALILCMAFNRRVWICQDAGDEGQAKKTVGGTRRETEAPPVTVEIMEVSCWLIR